MTYLTETERFLIERVNEDTTAEINRIFGDWATRDLNTAMGLATRTLAQRVLTLQISETGHIETTIPILEIRKLLTST